eukprot:573158-Amphidinium_carterae.1
MIRVTIVLSLSVLRRHAQGSQPRCKPSRCHGLRRSLQKTNGQAQCRPLTTILPNLLLSAFAPSFGTSELWGTIYCTVPIQ